MNVTALLFSAAAGVCALASAQQAGQPAVPRLSAVVQPKNSKTNKLATITLVPPSNMAKGVFAYIANGNAPQPIESTTKNYKVFLVTTPPELAVAGRAYAKGDLVAASRQLNVVRTKYRGFVSLPDNPAHKAAMMELNCYARLQAWAAVGKLVDIFPGVEFLDEQDKAVLAAARILSHVSDDPLTAAARRQEAETALANAAMKNNRSPMVYGWLKYARARAMAADFSKEMLAAGIPESKETLAQQAVDALCEAAMATKGRDMELPVDAMKRAFAIMWAMPGVKAYAGTIRQMDKKAWENAPIDFREAVAMANMIQNIFEPDCKDEAISKAATFFYNIQKGKKQIERTPHL